MRKDRSPPQEPAGNLEVTGKPNSLPGSSQAEMKKKAAPPPTELVLKMREMMQKAKLKEEAAKSRKKASQRRKEDLRKEEDLKMRKSNRSMVEMLKLWKGVEKSGIPHITLKIDRKAEDGEAGRNSLEEDEA